MEAIFAALTFHQGNAPLPQNRLGDQQRPPVVAAAQGNHRIVLDQQEHVINLPGAPSTDQGELELPGWLESDPAQLDHGTPPLTRRGRSVHTAPPSS